MGWVNLSILLLLTPQPAIEMHRTQAPILYLTKPLSEATLG